jgi:hypothetical protein
MSMLVPTNDETPNKISVAQAVAVLAYAARKELSTVEAQLKAAGFEIAGYSEPQPPKPKVSESAAVGQLIAGRGIFVGAWEPKDQNGRSLAKTFNVFAAPEDLTDSSGRKALLTFRQAAAQVSSLRNWHGHDGGTFENEAALCNALGKDFYNGEWFVPTGEFLIEGLYRNKNQGDLKGTFATKPSGSDDASWYWSCTEPRDIPDYVLIASFLDGDDYWDVKDNNRLSCRPVRVEAVSHLAL